MPLECTTPASVSSGITKAAITKERMAIEEHDKDLSGRLNLKAINPKFLLKYDEEMEH